MLSSSNDSILEMSIFRRYNYFSSFKVVIIALMIPA